MPEGLTLQAAPVSSVLLILGIGVFGGTLGAWVFQRLRIPQVIGYIAIGMLLGQTGLGILHPTDLAQLRPFSFLALAVIGFLVGGELELSTFREYGRQFIAIMFGEGISAFLLAGGGCATLLWLLTGDPRVALAGGAVFGAIGSATDPASTMDVLWEYRSKGVLTTSLVSIIAMDDALAMILYALGTTLAALAVATGPSLSSQLLQVAAELSGSLALGATFGALLHVVLRISQSPERSLTVMTGTLLLIAGICLAFHLDVILAAMAAGVVLVNLSPTRTHGRLKTLRAFSTPIQVMFFVLVGARLRLVGMPGWIWGLAGLYIVGSMMGKLAGTRLGASLTHAPREVKNHLGLGLFSQGGVAVGLSMMAAQTFSGVEVTPGHDLGSVIVGTIALTTLALQVIGPPCTKLASKLSGEIGRNVTEEDVIQDLKVCDVMNTGFISLPSSTLLEEIFATMSRENQMVFPVVNPAGACVGVISFESLKSLFMEQELWNWMIAEDVMAPQQHDLLLSDTPLEAALRLMDQTDTEQIVILNPETRAPLGCFDLRTTKREITRHLMARQGV